MYCPRCKSRKTNQIKSVMRTSDINKRCRRYECLDCGFIFSTIETVKEYEDKEVDRL